MSKNEFKANKEEKQINESMQSTNQFKINQEEIKKIKISPITDFNKNSKESKTKSITKVNN